MHGYLGGERAVGHAAMQKRADDARQDSSSEVRGQMEDHGHRGTGAGVPSCMRRAGEIHDTTSNEGAFGP